MIQPVVKRVVKPVVKPVWQPVWQPVVSCKRGLYIMRYFKYLYHVSTQSPLFQSWHL